MSRLENKPVQIPDKVKVLFTNNVLEINGPNGTLRQVISDKIQLNINNVEHIISITKSNNICKSKYKRYNSLQGLFRGLIINMLQGVTIGFKKDLEIRGLGYKAYIENNSIILSVGFSHVVKFIIPQTLQVKTKVMPNKTTLISIYGIDKCEVGTFAAILRQVKPPEPYKGSGIKYLNEQIIRKAGKAAASSNKK
jgi:large subunit ribosomal protein L6